MQRSSIGLVTAAALVLAAWALLSAGCSDIAGEGGSAAPPSANAVAATPAAEGENASAAEQAVAAAGNRFAFDLYRALAADPANSGENIVVSPFSIGSALAIAGEGARGDTAAEIRGVIRLGNDSQGEREGYRSLIERFGRPQGNVTLTVANALWAEQTYQFLPEYVRTAREDYRAEAAALDFAAAPDASRRTINAWVAAQTSGIIDELLPEGAITMMTRLVITNAVYFHGTWLDQFDPNLTKEAAFAAPGGTVPVRMMERTGADARYRYAETGMLQLLELPYAPGNGTAFSMVVVLPKGDNLTAVEASLSPENLSAWRSAASAGRVDVYLPKFVLEGEYDLKPTLAGMGMPTAFTTAADLSGMDGTRDLSITDVVHKAHLNVNEEGTEAAAATGVVVGITAAREVPVFRADHPFVVLIVEERSGAVLFMGKATDPSA